MAFGDRLNSHSLVPIVVECTSLNQSVLISAAAVCVDVSYVSLHLELSTNVSSLYSAEISDEFVTS